MKQLVKINVQEPQSLAKKRNNEIRSFVLKRKISLYKQIYSPVFTTQPEETFIAAIARCAGVHIPRQSSLSQSPPAIWWGSAGPLPYHKPHSLPTTRYSTVNDQNVVDCAHQAGRVGVPSRYDACLETRVTHTPWILLHPAEPSLLGWRNRSSNYQALETPVLKVECIRQVRDMSVMMLKCSSKRNYER